MKFRRLFLQLLDLVLITVHPSEPHPLWKMAINSHGWTLYLLSSVQHVAEQIEKTQYFVNTTGKNCFLRAWGEHVPQLG